MKTTLAVLAILLLCSPAFAGGLNPGTYSTTGGYKEIFFNGEGKAGMALTADGSGGSWLLGQVGNEATNALDAVLSDSGPGWVEYTTEYTSDYFLLKESAGTWGGSGDMLGKVTSLIVNVVFNTNTGAYVGGKFTAEGYVNCSGNDVGIRMVGKLTEEKRDYETFNIGGTDVEILRHHGKIKEAYLTIVPLPAAAWAGLGLLGLMGLIRRLRNR